MGKSLKVKTSQNIVTLTDKDYKAAGGQGVVYCKNGLAYKVYHDPNKMIPVAKIKELSVLKDDTILGPTEPLYSPASNKPIGFTMPYVDGTEFLCKIFTKNFRLDNGISPQDIVHLVTRMQKALQYIHQHKILVVDYNEMNFLLSSDFKTVYSIDVDSWQTPNFPAMALMDSVRDRKGPKGKFSELTDWFSFAVVTFQMYVGIHPYKGFHPDFRPADWSKRMDAGISVFDKNVTLPPACQDFSVIPSKHLGWYKDIFVKNNRSIPPYPDTTMVSVHMGQIVSSKGQFIVELIKEYETAIQDVYFFDGKRYVLTVDGLYCDDTLLKKRKKSTEKRAFGLCYVPNEDPVLSYLNNGTALFSDVGQQSVWQQDAECLMPANGCVYVVSNGSLLENAFDRLGKLIHTTKVVSSICPSYRIFPGLVVQDDFMKCHLAIPYERGLCANVHVTDLDGHRIVDAKHEGYVTVLIAEHNGKYSKYIICYNKNFSGYSLKEEQMNSLHAVNFIALPNGLYFIADDTKAVLFKDNTAGKEFKDVPVNSGTPLYHEGMTVYFTEENKLYRVRMS